jgi:hypothetical protein
MTKKEKISESIESMMTDALLRSGYVMESRIVHTLVQNGFFVEPNQRIIDTTKGKNREIDFVAELWDSAHDRAHLDTKVSVSVRFVCEAKNNPHPVVLLTELPFSPNLETWDSLHEGRTGLFRHEPFDPSFYDYLADGQKPYTQYCSFKPKKNEKDLKWLAWHPDDFHDDLEKIISCCRQDAQLISDLNDNYHRLFLYMPVVLLSGDLYVANPQGGTVSLSKVDYGLLMHFSIYEEAQCLSLVLFATEESYLALFKKLIGFGQNIENVAVQILSAKDMKP